MVHAVREPRPGILFHPKVWFLEYFDEDGTPVLPPGGHSRNLTNDASWDAVLSLDGVAGTRRRREWTAGRAARRPARAVLSTPSTRVEWSGYWLWRRASVG